MDRPDRILRYEAIEQVRERPLLVRPPKAKDSGGRIGLTISRGPPDADSVRTNSHTADRRSCPDQAGPLWVEHGARLDLSCP